MDWIQLSAVVASEELRLESHAGSHASSSASRSGQPVSPRGMPPNRRCLYLLSHRAAVTWEACLTGNVLDVHIIS